jgi:hypothetical protein
MDIPTTIEAQNKAETGRRDVLAASPQLSYILREHGLPKLFLIEFT